MKRTGKLVSLDRVIATLEAARKFYEDQARAPDPPHGSTRLRELDEEAVFHYQMAIARVKKLPTVTAPKKKEPSR